MWQKTKSICFKDSMSLKSPTCQSPHWWQHGAVNEGAHRERQSKRSEYASYKLKLVGEGSRWEVKFSALYLPGDEGIHLSILSLLSKSWHLRFCHLSARFRNVWWWQPPSFLRCLSFSSSIFSIFKSSFPLWTMRFVQRSWIKAWGLAWLARGEKLNQGRFSLPAVSPVFIYHWFSTLVFGTPKDRLWGHNFSWNN